MQFAQPLARALSGLLREEEGASAAEFVMVGSIVVVLCLLVLLALWRDA
jgi:Flp pilus assembly pilin Flp